MAEQPNKLTNLRPVDEASATLANGIYCSEEMRYIVEAVNSDEARQGRPPYWAESRFNVNELLNESRHTILASDSRVQDTDSTRAEGVAGAKILELHITSYDRDRDIKVMLMVDAGEDPANENARECKVVIGNAIHYISGRLWYELGEKGMLHP